MKENTLHRILKLNSQATAMDKHRMRVTLANILATLRRPASKALGMGIEEILDDTRRKMINDSEKILIKDFNRHI